MNPSSQPLEGQTSPRKGTSAITTPQSLDTIKQMFDSATMLRMEAENPFKGSKDLNRTNNSRFINQNSPRSPSQKQQDPIQVQIQSDPDAELPQASNLRQKQAIDAQRDQKQGASKDMQPHQSIHHHYQQNRRLKDSRHRNSSGILNAIAAQGGGSQAKVRHQLFNILNQLEEVHKNLNEGDKDQQGHSRHVSDYQSTSIQPRVSNDQQKRGSDYPPKEIVYPKLLSFMDNFEKEMSTIREQNYYLNRQFNDNLIEMKQQAQHLNNQRVQVQNELESLRRQQHSSLIHQSEKLRREPVGSASRHPYMDDLRDSVEKNLSASKYPERNFNNHRTTSLTSDQRHQVNNPLVQSGRFSMQPSPYRFLGPKPSGDRFNSQYRGNGNSTSLRVESQFVPKNTSVPLLPEINLNQKSNPDLSRFSNDYQPTMYQSRTPQGLSLSESRQKRRHSRQAKHQSDMSLPESTFKESGLDDLYEIEKINERVADQIGKNAERTKEIVTREEETRQRFLGEDMPITMGGGGLHPLTDHISPRASGSFRQGQATFKPRVSPTEASYQAQPLSKQLLEQQKVSEMRAFYERDLDNFVHVQNKSNERISLMLENNRNAQATSNASQNQE